jgi:predicted RNA-binding protein with RPS1 domain
MPADTNSQPSLTEAPRADVQNQSAILSEPTVDAALPGESADSSAAEAAAKRRRILIGSQRDPAAYRARQKRDWIPVEESGDQANKIENGEEAAKISDQSPIATQPPSPPSSQQEDVVSPPSNVAAPFAHTSLSQGLGGLPLRDITAPSAPPPLTPDPILAPLPDLDADLSPDLDDASLDALLAGGDQTAQEPFEPNSLHAGRIIALRRDDVFVEFAGRQQGVAALRQFDVPPRVGAEMQFCVQRLNPDDGLYELGLPNATIQVDDWSDLVEGAMVEVHVTGHNAGGLECEVNHIRGFIPISQVSLYRVEDLAQFVDQRLACVISEANPERRNLVVSRRAVLEREREQARQQMLASLKPGQVHEGVVRKLMDFGAFVDLGGGVDGLLHVSQLAWGRVNHPKDVLQEGQQLKVRVEKVDPVTGKISLAYRDLLENPWTTAAQKFPQQQIVTGTVTKLMDFGAFVELEPGVEGLVHVSELSHKRVWRPSDVVKVGDRVEAIVLSIDTQAQRISLSMKALAAPPEPSKKEQAEADAALATSSKKKAKPTGPLRGGLSRSTGDRFGLKW